MQTEENGAEKNGNPKVELYIKKDRDSGTDGEATIDFVRLFSTMKKRRRFFLKISAALILLGMAAGLFVHTVSQPHPPVRAIVSLNYPGAASGKAPDGSPLETDSVKSAYVVSSALSSVRLSYALPAASVAANIEVERILSDESKKNLDALSGLDKKSNAYYEGVKNLELVYTNRMIVTLKNGFKVGNDEIVIPDSELKTLLESVIERFREWLTAEFADMSKPELILDTGKDVGNDYIDQLDRVSDFLKSLSSFAARRIEAFPSYRSSVNGLSFSDVKTMIDRELNVETAHIYSHIYLNSISVNPSLQLTSLEYRLGQLKIERAELVSGIEAVSASITEYKNELLEIIRTGDSTGTSQAITSDYYNSLIIKYADMTEELADLDESIAKTEDRIEGYSAAVSAGSGEISDVDVKIATAYNNCVTAANLLYSLNDELIESGSFKGALTNSICAFVKTDNPLDKKLIVGVAAGAAAGLLIWFGNALVLEFKYSSAGKEDN